MKLNTKQTRRLRGLAHHLNPVVQIGKAGLTSAVIKDVDGKLANHELIKIRIGTEDRDELRAITDLVTSETTAALVQVIGRIAVLYRPAEDPVISLV